MKQQLALLVTTLTLVGVSSTVEFEPLGLSQKAAGHMIETNYNLLDQALEFTSTYSSGEPVPEAQVFIYAPNNPDEPWIELTTDEEGYFSFTPDQSIPGDWEIHIKKDMGHEDFWTVPVASTGIDYFNISRETGDTAAIATNKPFVELLGLVGLGLCAGIATYKLRQR